MKWWICVVLALTTSIATAQDAKPKEPPAYKLTFKHSTDKPKGKVSTWKGVAGSQGDRFFAENLLVLQPVIVTVIAKNKGDKVHVTLAKMKWTEKLREADTNEKGFATLRTRTQGDLRVIVSAEKPGTPYHLAVWVGNEVTPEFKPVVASMKEFKAKGGDKMVGKPDGKAQGGTSPAVYVVVALVLLGLIVLVIRVKKRGLQ